MNKKIWSAHIFIHIFFIHSCINFSLLVIIQSFENKQEREKVHFLPPPINT